ncbi:hypothetical protein E2C01_062598 [Portunus trituberculatus]|uniref:Uncharacterized protein n=1 Tax=Portunus trituberculatus TaxID=210409 RepID=A0A5B7HHR4_PORTR|nr:hypothetical protein [Portunus trituberculatus]
MGILTQFVQGSDNVVADCLNRQHQILSTEWTLHMDVCHQLWQGPAPARHLVLNNPPKRPAMSPSIAKKKWKSLTLEVKLDIINRHEGGEKM